MKLAENLRRLMDETSLGERELARRTTVPQPVIHRILNGHTPNPTIETLQKLAKHFVMSVSELTGEVPLKTSMTGMRPDHAAWQHVPILSKDQVFEYLKTKKLPETSQYMPIDIEPSDHIFAFAVPDNMMEPTLSKQDIAVIDARRVTPSSRVIVMVSEHGQLFFREYAAKEKEGFFKTYHPVQMQKPAKDQKIIGSVIQCKKYFKV